MSIERDLIAKLKELLDYKKGFAKYVPYVQELESEIASLDKQLLEQRCNKIYEKVKESWTPDKKTFEEAWQKPIKSTEEILKPDVREKLIKFAEHITNKDFSYAIAYGEKKPFCKTYKDFTCEQIVDEFLKPV
jgi:hypothetical protein